MNASTIEARSYSGNWHGKTKLRAVVMRLATTNLIVTLKILNIKADGIYDWDDEFESYVNRILWSELDKTHE